jgi:nucleotide-binding universal stress UspA family protein
VLANARAIADGAVALAQRKRPTVVARPLAAPGDPRVALADLSEDAHLVVMGSRGRGPLRSMLLGSVSSGVTKYATCPVVVCRPPLPGVTTRGVVVGADGTPESLPVVKFAFAFASLRVQPLTVLHVYWDAVAAVAGLRGGPEEVLDHPDVEELRVALSQSVAGFSEKYPDVSVSLRLQHGLVDEVLTPRDKGQLETQDNARHRHRPLGARRCSRPSSGAGRGTHRGAVYQSCPRVSSSQLIVGLS